MRPASVGFQCPDDATSGTRESCSPVTSVGAALTDGKPVVTYVLIAVNLLVYLVCGARANSLTSPTSSKLFQDWVMVPAFVRNHEYYRLDTSAFLHLGPVHIFANMLSLFIIGPHLERLLGRWRFGVVYLLCGLGGGVAIYLFGDVLGPVGGASGAIFGLFGACLILVRKLGLDLMWLASTVVLNFVFRSQSPGFRGWGTSAASSQGWLSPWWLLDCPTRAVVCRRTTRSPDWRGFFS